MIQIRMTYVHISIINMCYDVMIRDMILILITHKPELTQLYVSFYYVRNQN